MFFMGVWEFLKLLVGSRDNPLVRYGGGKHGAFYSILCVMACWILAIGWVIYTRWQNTYTVEIIYLLISLAVVVLIPGVCIRFLTPKRTSDKDLEELCLTGLTRKEVVVGFLRFPLIISVICSLGPCLAIVFVCLKYDACPVELMPVAVASIVGGILLAIIVYARKWLVSSRGVFSYILTGYVEIFFYFVALSVMVSLLVFFLFLMGYSKYDVAFFRFFRSNEPLLSVFIVVLGTVLYIYYLFKRVLLTAPQCLFRHIDQKSYFDAKWMAREFYTLKDKALRKRISSRQSRFMYPTYTGALVRSLGVVGIVGSCIVVALYFRPYPEDVQFDQTLWVKGILMGAFGFSGFLGLSMIFPLVAVSRLVGKKVNRKLSFLKGGILLGIIRYIWMLLIVQVVWTLLGDLLFDYFGQGGYEYSYPGDYVEFILFQLFLVIPLSVGAFLFLITRRQRRRWFFLFKVTIFAVMITPMYLLVGSYHNSNFLYETEWNCTHLVIPVFWVLALITLVFGIDWLGGRYYASQGGKLEVAE
jgi:hypothetical protein